MLGLGGRGVRGGQALERGQGMSREVRDFTHHNRFGNKGIE
jgi:hypothetical protein